MEQFGGVAGFALAGGEEGARILMRQLEPALEELGDDPTLVRAEMVVAARRLGEERRQGEPERVLRRRRGGAGSAGQPFENAVDHPAGA